MSHIRHTLAHSSPSLNSASGGGVTAEGGGGGNSGGNGSAAVVNASEEDSNLEAYRAALRVANTEEVNKAMGIAITAIKKAVNFHSLGSCSFNKVLSATSLLMCDILRSQLAHEAHPRKRKRANSPDEQTSTSDTIIGAQPASSVLIQANMEAVAAPDVDDEPASQMASKEGSRRQSEADQLPLQDESKPLSALQLAMLQVAQEKTEGTREGSTEAGARKCMGGKCPIQGIGHKHASKWTHGHTRTSSCPLRHPSLEATKAAYSHGHILAGQTIGAHTAKHATQIIDQLTSQHPEVCRRDKLLHFANVDCAFGCGRDGKCPLNFLGHKNMPKWKEGHKLPSMCPVMNPSLVGARAAIDNEEFWEASVIAALVIMKIDLLSRKHERLTDGKLAPEPQTAGRRCTQGKCPLKGRGHPNPSSWHLGHMRNNACPLHKPSEKIADHAESIGDMQAALLIRKVLKERKMKKIKKMETSAAAAAGNVSSTSDVVAANAKSDGVETITDFATDETNKAKQHVLTSSKSKSDSTTKASNSTGVSSSLQTDTADPSSSGIEGGRSAGDPGRAKYPDVDVDDDDKSDSSGRQITDNDIVMGIPVSSPVRPNSNNEEGVTESDECPPAPEMINRTLSSNILMDGST